MSKPRIATVWLDGCSGCHMSLLDMDERIIDLAQVADIVYSPVIDPKLFPDNVDVTLVEGAVSSEEDVHKIVEVRAKSKFLVSLGDCAVTGNVPSLRNPFELEELLNRAYVENASFPVAPADRKPPTRTVPPLCPKTRPIHEVVKVDLYVPGCPPPAEAIFFVVSELVAGRIPDPNALTRFGK